jgi:hypothetical protein
MFGETTRYIAVSGQPSPVTQWRRTGWLRREDSNLRIRIGATFASESSRFRGVNPENVGYRFLSLQRVTAFAAAFDQLQKDYGRTLPNRYGGAQRPQAQVSWFHDIERCPGDC